MSTPGDPPPLAEDGLDADPIVQFRAWRRDAEEARVRLAEAAALATTTPDGAPSARMVLLKDVDDRGFVFHTNYESRKARELAANPRAAIVVYWNELGRQVRIEGAVERVSTEESAEYFRTRPRGGQLGAWASRRQSEVIPSRAVLDERFHELEAEYADADVPLPPFWGGYRLRPDVLEFWQHRDDRLHDRLRYRRSGDGWVIERLAP